MLSRGTIYFDKFVPRLFSDLGLVGVGRVQEEGIARD